MVGQAAAVDELLALVESTQPDVAIVDIRMPPTFTDEGLRAVELDPRAPRRRDRHPGPVAVTPSPPSRFASSRRERAGVGYLLKDRVSDLEDFTEAVRRVSRGGSVVDPAVVSKLVGQQSAPDRLSELTAREREVLGLVAEGRSNQAIADRIFVTEKTVEAHIASIFSKLELLPAPDDHRRVLAVLAYLEA